jgi:hypothetical protein
MRLLPVGIRKYPRNDLLRDLRLLLAGGLEKPVKHFVIGHIVIRSRCFVMCHHS